MVQQLMAVIRLLHNTVVELKQANATLKEVRALIEEMIVHEELKQFEKLENLK